jgi:hypothetical protein
MQPSKSESPFASRPAITGCALLLALVSLGGKPKPKPAPRQAPPGPELPSDLNIASLRVHAIDTLYELDLSPAQMNMLRTVADGMSDDHKRTAAVGNEKVTAAFADFNKALLARTDDQEIAKARNTLTELVTSDDVHLDDDVEPTSAARTKAPEISRKFTAGQIAAYLAAHADQIAGPVEKMMGVLTELHDGVNATDTVAQIKEAAEDIGRTVGGSDAKKTGAVTEQVSAWLKSHQDVTDEQLVAHHDELESAAEKVIGDVPPMEILGNWVDGETATLLSNPQLPEAVTAILAAREQDH